MLGDPLPTVVRVQGTRVTLPSMEQDTATLEAPESTDELIEEELLVEEISIDGMCGVY
jgi:mycofactocin precursor